MPPEVAARANSEVPSGLRVVFAGTPEFAQVALQSIHAAGFQLVGVYTQPDRPAGRGMQLQASPVKRYAVAQGWPVFQPKSLKLAEAQAELQALQADVMVVAAYGLILPQSVLDAPRFGCLNIHASLLPRWRGAAPIHRAIEAGDRETGITIMQMDAGLDTGPMICRGQLSIGPQETTGHLHDRLARMGGQLMVDSLQTLQAAQARLPAVEQTADAALVSYAHKISKAEALLDFQQDASVLARKIRAFDPFPGAQAQVGGVLLKCWGAEIDDAATQPSLEIAPGTVVSCTSQGLKIQCGSGILRLTEVQKPGGRRQALAEAWAGLKPLVLA
jgi:methionyl-tRNA formyltransferase